MNIGKKISAGFHHNIEKRENYLAAFLIGTLAFFIMVLPIIVLNGGYYTYYGDYNSQQIPFYSHAHEFIRNEGLGWDWGTDLGANFVGSYAFYLLGSPFFWLTIPFPRDIALMLMPFLLAMKFGFAAMTSYAYIRRFVRDKYAALIGGLLYAYSGFQIFNIFFNHFHDVTAFFPLMLIALEERVNKDRRGVFAVSVALMGIINYFFFTGQAVFIAIYILVRLKSPDFRITWRKFFSLAAEAVMGALIASVILVPAAIAVLGNYRVNERLYGMNMVSYGDRTRILRIIQSFFMIPDVPARPNLFSSDGGKWSSIGGYLPMFSMAGVIAFFGARKKNWAKNLIIVCMICAFIPILNSAFYTFNASYYARWFYMPILIMALMTAQVLDDTTVDFGRGIKICGIVLTSFGVISLFPKKNDDGSVVWFHFPKYRIHFCITLLFSILGLVALWYINRLRRQGRPFMGKSLALTVVCCVASTAAVEYFGAVVGNIGFIDYGIKGRENITLEEEEDSFFRVDISENYDNFPMFWELSSMRAFQSTVPASIMEFYPEVGVSRDVASRAPMEKYVLRGLFSVKYYFKAGEYPCPYDADKTLEGYDDLFEYKGLENGFDLYENKCYIPMGFAYDNYVTDKVIGERNDNTKERVLTRALVLTEEQAEKYKDIITELPVEDMVGLGKKSYIADCEKRREESSRSFVHDSEGFKAEIDLDSSKLVFFSVPYESGWEAYVNGKPADIEKVSWGFMAVKADAGENVIEFRYRTPGLREGAVMSVCGTGFLLLYLFVMRRSRKRRGFTHYYGYSATDTIRLREEYELSRIHGRFDKEE